jgi:sRNA-binding protein
VFAKLTDVRLRGFSSSPGDWGEQIQEWAKRELERRDAQEQAHRQREQKRREVVLDAATTGRVDPTDVDLNQFAQHAPTRVVPRPPKKPWWKFW